MAKNIKVNETNFKKLMSTKGYDSELVDEYLDFKKAGHQYDNKKIIARSVGIGEMIGTAGFGIWDAFNGADCGITIAILGGIGVLTTAVALLKKNPYTKLIEEEEDLQVIDKEYKSHKKMIKRNK